MSIKAFLRSDAGQAVAGLCMATLLFLWPPAASWLIACRFIAFSFAKLEAAGRRLKEQETDINHRPPITDPLAGTHLYRGHDDT